MGSNWVKIIECVDKNGLFTDGDWIESKDQDPHGEVRLIQLADIGDGTFLDVSERYVNQKTAQRLKCTFLKQGDILVARMPDPLGRCCIFPFSEEKKFITAVDVCIIRPKANVDNRYLQFIINSPVIRQRIWANRTGTTRARITRKKLGEFQIPLPPLPKQLRIVARLDSLFERIDRTIGLVEENIVNAESLLISFLNEIFINAKNESWEETTIGACFDLKTGGTPSTQNPEYYNDGTIKWLVSGDVNQGEIFDCDGRITELAVKNSNARVLPKNSVLIALNGQGKTRGTVAMLRTIATCNQSLVAMISKDDSKYLPDFLYYQLKWKYIPIRMITGMEDRRGLNMPIIRAIEVVFPDLLIQNKLVSTFRILEKYQNEIINQLLPKFEELKALKSSLLDAAFKGEL